MSAPAATVNPVAPPAPAPSRPAAATGSASDDHRFDRHLDAARQQQDEGKEQPAQGDGHDPASAKAPSTAKAGHGQATDAPAKDEGDPDAAALAAAMLALIGQAAPAKPLAQAGAV